jgi:lipopolysaccharide O-acetyltransferase
MPLSRHLEFARENGWLLLLSRVTTGIFRRLRDSLLARLLHAPGFRAGRSPRLLGLRHIRCGRDVHAADDLWLEAITDYAGQGYQPQLTLGDHLRLSDRVHIACLHKVTIGNGLLAGSGVLITDHAHGAYTGPSQSDPAIAPADRPLHSAGEVLIGANVWLGDGVAVLPGAVIGDGAIIGAHSVVTGTIPPATIAIGSPARPIRRWDPERREWLPIA